MKNIVIIGAGGAGLSAAIEAVENGAEKVIVLEMTAKTGGALNFTSGSMSAAGTIIQKEDGIEDSVDSYVADPYCGFIFTGSAYRDFFSGLNRLTKVEGVPADLPVLLFSGEKDPVGRGNGVQKVAEQLRKAGVKQVDAKLYPDARHEMFNELNRQEVYQDVAEWVEKVL